tara:strand:- start:88 stop:237 length:150 start_codon:yes stop_codon:yes gene_type:complete
MHGEALRKTVGPVLPSVEMDMGVLLAVAGAAEVSGVAHAGVLRGAVEAA